VWGSRKPRPDGLASYHSFSSALRTILKFSWHERHLALVLRHHQFLTDDIGNPHLEKLVAATVALMRISPNWRKFKGYIQRAFPIKNEQMELDIDKDDE